MTLTPTILPAKKHSVSTKTTPVILNEIKKTRKKVPLSVKYKKDLEDMKAGKNCVSRDTLAKQYL